MSDNVEQDSWATIILRGTSKVLESIQMAQQTGQSRYRLIPTGHLSSATRAGLRDMTLGVVRGVPVGNFNFE